MLSLDSMRLPLAFVTVASCLATPLQDSNAQVLSYLSTCLREAANQSSPVQKLRLTGRTDLVVALVCYGNTAQNLYNSIAPFASVERQGVYDDNRVVIRREFGMPNNIGISQC